MWLNFIPVTNAVTATPNQPPIFDGATRYSAHKSAIEEKFGDKPEAEALAVGDEMRDDE